MSTDPTLPEREDRFGGIRRQRGAATFLSVAALSFGALGFAACGEEEPVTAEEEAEIVETETPAADETDDVDVDVEPEQVTLPALLEDPQEWVGKTVAVAGAVADEEVDGEQNLGAAFTIGANLEEDLLVLPQQELTPEGITEGDVIIVEGTVRDVDEALAGQDDFLFEKEGLDADFLDEFDGEVALVATKIQPE